MPDSGDVFDLAGRVALVTGASRGLGRSYAAALARRGARIAITSRVIESLADPVRELEDLGAEVLPCALDTSKVETMQPCIDRVLERFGSIDILVNNAGSNVRKPAVEMLPSDWDGVVDTILRGTFFVSTAVVRSAMRPRRYGRIVNIGSGTSAFGMPGIAPYCAARGGITQLTRALAAEWATDGITVNALAPGWFKTAQNAVLYEDPDWLAGVIARIPAGRSGQPADLEGALVFLCSDAASYVTGQLLFVDGGFTTGAISAMPRPEEDRPQR
jgi:NAD(P)-dependent dehydrogenase (short-subunit alcohol dehydrogenase family)